MIPPAGAFEFGIADEFSIPQLKETPEFERIRTFLRRPTLESAERETFLSATGRPASILRPTAPMPAGDRVPIRRPVRPISRPVQEDGVGRIDDDGNDDVEVLAREPKENVSPDDDDLPENDLDYENLRSEDLIRLPNIFDAIFRGSV